VRSVKGERGIALVMVMWMIVLLVVLASEMVAAVKGDTASVINFREDREAYYLALAGVQMAMSEILREYDFNYYEGEEGMVFARLDEVGAEFEPAVRKNIPLGSGVVTYRITDENGKVNLNWLAGNPEGMIRLLQGLFPEGDIDIAEVIDSIRDWVDADDLVRLGGAESDYYNSLPEPYDAKNGPFDTVDELRKVKGITGEIYLVLADKVTVHSTSGVNLNTASPEALLATGVGEEEILNIIGIREADGYVDTAGRSNIFRVVADGGFPMNRMKHSILAVLERIDTGSIRILEWNDDYYGGPEETVIEE
jgi:general secretion pathway protein K